MVLLFINSYPYIRNLIEKEQMALIGQIREKSWLLLVVVGVAMLAFILPWDQIFNGASNRGEDYGIGTVNGEKVNDVELEQYTNNVAQNMFNSKRQQDPNFTGLNETDLTNAQNQAWNALVGKMLTVEEYEELGLMVTPYELDGILYGRGGFEPSPMIRQVAVDSNGLFSSAIAENILDQLKMNDPKRYNTVVEEIKYNRLTEKYMAMLTNGVKTTSLEAKESYEAGKTVKNVSYIFKRFSEIPANEIEVTEDEMRDYYNAHKNEKKYDQQGMRKITYFSMPLVPSEDDTISSMNNMVQLKNSFSNAENDTLFVEQYTQREAKSIKFFPEDTYNALQGGQLVYPTDMDALKVGDIVGPINTANFVGVAKVKAIDEQKQAHVRHILISANKENEEEYNAARAKADSILAVIKANGNFEEMEAEFNQDPGGKMNHGVYKNFPEGVMVPEFNDFAFDQPVGSIDVVPTQFGFHIVEVMGQRTVPVYDMFAINRPVTASAKTISKRKTEARRVITEIERAIADFPLDKRTQAFDSVVRELDLLQDWRTSWISHHRLQLLENKLEIKSSSLLTRKEMSRE